jgi:hypothetical protein
VLEALMAKGAAGIDLLGFKDPQTRAAHYREEAERFRSLAAAETAVPLRNSLLYLARQYEQLAANVLNRLTLRRDDAPRHWC